ncbi:hypothetical protein IMZ48_23115 [Candidatus Bathyarchaeota archaeon]|nr:hypothetical protein [Candidatus Bathyarchaeota archaeon]
MAQDDLLTRLQLHVDPSAQVLICGDEACGFALLPYPTIVSNHLRQRHGIPSDERRQVTSLLKARTTPLAYPTSAPLPRDGSPRNLNLQLYDGFACKFCKVRTVSAQVISRHVAAAHEKQRLQLHGDLKAMYDPVYLQTWTRSPSASAAQYWIAERHGDAVGRREETLKRSAEGRVTPEGKRMRLSPAATPLTSLGAGQGRAQQDQQQDQQQYQQQDQPGWSDGPPFGRIIEAVSVEAADELQQIVSHLHGKQATIRPMNGSDAELVTAEVGVGSDGSIGDRNAYHKANPWVALIRRLEHSYKITDDWSHVGCELCFAETGRREPDHGLEACQRQPACGAARHILQWLESLAIPRFFDHRGTCSTCAHGWAVCDEIRMSYQIFLASEKGDQGRHADLISQYDSKEGPDGYCGNKPVVRRMIAALCAYDNQLLGKVLTRVALDDGVDLSSESQSRRWLEQRIRLPNDHSVSRLMYVLDQLIMAFDFRKAQQPATPEHAATTPDCDGPSRWDNELEGEEMRVYDHETAASWLMQPKDVSTVEGSEMIRQVSIWTHGLDEFTATAV